MNPSDVFVKTAMGRLEIETRRNKLGRDLRFVLVMVDGRTTAGEILRQAVSAGAVAGTFDELTRAGYIALEPSSVPAKADAAAPPVATVPPSSAESRFFDTRQLMTDTVVNAMGLRSFGFTLKLEKANSVEDLRTLVDDFTKLVEKGNGKLEAEVLVSRVKELLR